MAKQTRNYLALDLGAESGRGIVGRFDGKKIKLEEVYRFQQQPLQSLGSLHWDALQIAHHLRLALGAGSERTRGSLASLAVDTWGVDYVLLDRNDDLLHYPHHYRDSRNDGMMAKAFKTMSADAIYEETGIQFLPFNTLIQLCAEKAAATGALEAAKTFLFMPDYLSFMLGGRKANEYTIASTAQMLDARGRKWSSKVLKAFDLPAGIFQSLVEPGTVLGKVNATTAEISGASRDIKVVATGSHDTASAVAAVPAQGRGNWAYLSSGTWSLLGCEEPQPVINALTRKLNYTNEAGLEKSIRLLTNIMGLWVVQQLRAAWTDRKGNAPGYAELTQAAAAAPAFGPLVRINWAPFLKPGKMPEKIAQFCTATGQKAPRTQGEFVRCALESLAMTYRIAVGQLGEIRGEPIGKLHIVGGGTKNELLNQLTADACGIEVLTGPEEATALGNILGQMLADKTIKTLDEGRAIIRASFKVNRYLPRDTAAWDAAHARFVKMKSPSERTKF